MTRNLVEHQITEEQAARIEHEMRAAFEEAEVDQAEFTRLEPAMTNDEKDRHVLAAAVAADAELIVTFDTADFPPQACEPLGVEATHPDDVFDLHDLKPESRARTAGRRPRPLSPLGELLCALTTAGGPRFVYAIRAPRRVLCRSEPEPTALPEPPRRESGLFKPIHRPFTSEPSNPNLAALSVDAQGEKTRSYLRLVPGERRPLRPRPARRVPRNLRQGGSS
jgi:hypothetical protein